jgi:hypothetical protein
MAYAFYVLGVLVTGGGIWWTVVAYNAASGASPGAAQAFAMLMIAAPGFSVIFAGLILLAIGGGLARLDTIARYSRQTARLMRAMQEQANQP